MSETALHVLEMLQLLERTTAGSLPLNRLAEHFGVHRRTVIRWVDSLSTHVDSYDGEPLVRRERRSGSAWVVLSRERHRLSASIFQYAATYAATLYLDAGDGSLLSDSAGDALDRLRPAGDSGQTVARAFHYVPFGPKRYREQEDLLDVLVQAVIRCRPIDMRYRGPSGAEYSARLEPFTIVMYRDGLYLLGRRMGDSPVFRLYAIDRMVSLEIDRAARFEVPAAFDPAAHLGSGMGLWQIEEPAQQVEIAFHPSVVSAVQERNWPGYVGWTEADWPILRLQLPITPELVTWVISWADTAEVLAPDSLRQRLGTLLHDAARRYLD